MKDVNNMFIPCVSVCIFIFSDFEHFRYTHSFHIQCPSFKQVYPHGKTLDLKGLTALLNKSTSPKETTTDFLLFINLFMIFQRKEFYSHENHLYQI